jgi:glycerol-3-phosphate dehydrogenase (NAD(P)+)
VLINGVPAKQFSVDQLYANISDQQAAIKKLEAIEPKPKRLEKEIAARKAGVRTPILDAVYSVLYENKQAAAAMHELLNRDPRPETS